MTVDSDTSTSRHLPRLRHRQGAAIAPIATADDPRAVVFAEALADVLHELAHPRRPRRRGRDQAGRPSTSTGAESDASAFRIAQSIANSPLVKTAIAGEDANWGRVVMAVGKAGEPADRDRLSISFGDIRVATQGERDPTYDEAAVSAYMQNEEIEIGVELGLGERRRHGLYLRPHPRLHHHQR